MIKRIWNALLPRHEPNVAGQRVRIVCTVMGVFGAVFAYETAWLALLVSKTLLDQDIAPVVFHAAGPSTIVHLSTLIVSLASIWWCGRYVQKNDAPRPDGWGQPIVAKSDALAHPDLVWAVRQVWESGYIHEDETIYFGTLRDILKAGGLKVTAAQIRSALQIAGCKVTRDSIQESVLATLFQGMDAEPTDDENDSAWESDELQSIEAENNA